VEPRITEDAAGRFAWLVDPVGNRIELWEPKSGLSTEFSVKNGKGDRIHLVSCRVRSSFLNRR